MAIVDLIWRTRFAALAMLAAPARLALLAALPGLTLLAVAWPPSAHAETAIHFTLDRKLDGPAAPFFLAIDNGYFKAEGLDVTIDAATSGPFEAIDRLTVGKDDMGVSDINVLIKLRDTGKTAIKGLFVVFDKPPYAIIARKSRGIARPRDLEGKTVAAPSGDPTAALWPIFARVNGVDTAKVTLENVGLPVREPMLAAGEVDAITGCPFTSYINLKTGGVPSDDLVVLLMADYGVELYGDAIMVAPNFAQEKPDAVRAFLRAYVKALKDTVRDPANAVNAVLRRSEGAKKEVELERLRMAIRDNIVTRAVRTDGYGAIDPARFAAGIDQIALGYSFKAKDKAAGAFDPSFLPAAAERRVSETASR
jgi:NitT/TauT family transport system substrate-binding protein